ncbi:tyrosine-type recombinase/integrase [Clostridium tagluense]|uniref:Tyrosine recombinase XerC n=1 Tax=Clostridium tagluense TaxID=360422 RepID=A0A401UT66_9CLOT|nr:tyrosine-type recombinase/integrase [Clostridium tagluense]GCD12648.1 tyrosine recombinase XerC [Clostridium tagluense]
MYMDTEYKVLNSFLGYLKSQKNRSINTIITYETALLEMHNWMKKEKGIEVIDKSFYKTIELQNLIDFVSFLDNKKITGIKNNGEKANGANTIATKTNSIRTFFRYLKRISVITDNISEELDVPKIGTRIPIYLTETEIPCLINAIEITKTRLKLRNITIIYFLLTLGMRVNELVNIKISDITDDNLRFVGKGNKDRLLPIPKKPSAYYHSYLEERKNNIVIDDFLFLSKSGKQMGESDINDMIHKYCKIANIKSISAHKLRHTSATLMKKNDVDIAEIQKVLGHEKISTTQIYTHVDLTDVTKAISKNPYAN